MQWMKRWLLLGIGSLWLGGCGDDFPTKGDTRATPGFLEVELPGGAGMEFVWVEPGSFLMGTTEEERQRLVSKGWWYDWMEDEFPAHEVTISQGFWLGKYEITQRAVGIGDGFKAVVGEGQRAGKSELPGGVYFVERCAEVYPQAKRGRWRFVVPFAYGSGVGVCLPGGDEYSVVVRRRRTAVGCVCVVLGQHLCPGTVLCP